MPETSGIPDGFLNKSGVSLLVNPAGKDNNFVMPMSVLRKASRPILIASHRDCKRGWIEVDGHAYVLCKQDPTQRAEEIIWSIVEQQQYRCVCHCMSTANSIQANKDTEAKVSRLIALNRLFIAPRQLQSHPFQGKVAR